MLGHIVHVDLENMQWRVGFSEKFLSFSHPILMTLDVVLKIKGTSRLAVKLSQAFENITDFFVLWPLPKVIVLRLLVQR